MASAHSGIGERNIDLGVKVGHSVTARQEMSLLGPFSHPMVGVGTAPSSLLPHPAQVCAPRLAARGIISLLGSQKMSTSSPGCQRRSLIFLSEAGALLCSWKEMET